MPFGTELRLQTLPWKLLITLIIFAKRFLSIDFITFLYVTTLFIAVLEHAPTQSRLVFADSWFISQFSLGPQWKYWSGALHSGYDGKFLSKNKLFNLPRQSKCIVLPLQTVYYMFISDAQKVFSNPETELILYVALGRYSLFWGSSGIQSPLLYLLVWKKEVT